MKQIREFMDHTEALMAKDYLAANGIESDLQGTREYSSIIVGGTQGRYFLSVVEHDEPKALELLARSNLQIAEQIAHPTEIAEVALKKSVMWTFIAIVILPIVGNVISVREAIKYARLERSGKKWPWLFLISWMQLPGFYIAWILLKTILGGSPLELFE